MFFSFILSATNQSIHYTQVEIVNSAICDHTEISQRSPASMKISFGLYVVLATLELKCFTGPPDSAVWLIFNILSEHQYVALHKNILGRLHSWKNVVA